MGGITNKWDYKDKNVDQNISTEKILNSARFILYAAPHKEGTDIEFKAVGLVQGVSFGENKQVTRIFELGSESPYLIPGLTDGQITISRIMLNGYDLLNALYGKSTADDSNDVFRSLRDTNQPLDIMFAAYSDDEDDQLTYSRVFSQAMITSRSESIASGQTVIAEQCSMIYKNVSKYEAAI